MYTCTYIHIIYTFIPNSEFSFVIHVKLAESVGLQQARLYT